MKRSRVHKSYPSWRQRDTRSIILSLVVGIIAAAVTGVVVYFANRGRGF
jgi:hypothetical protein